MRTGKVICGAALLALCAAGQETHTTKSGLAVTELSVVPVWWAHGMIEWRFVIENRLPERRTVTLELPAEPMSMSRGKTLGSLSGSVTVEAGGKAALSLLQPLLRAGFGGDMRFAVREPGREREDFALAGPDAITRVYHRNDHPVSLLLPKRVSAEQTEKSLSAATNELVTGVAITRTELDAGVWPENWLAYSAFDGCLLDAETEGRLGEGARAALRDYAAAGGTVALLGRAELPEAWRAGCEAEDGTPGRWRLGFGQVLAAGAAALLSACADTRGSSKGQEFRTKVWDIEKCLDEIPVSGGVEVPVKAFLATLLLFVLVAGPGAVILTARLNRRMWLLVAVPAVSLAFGAAVFVSAVCAEGVTPSVRRQAVTLLDQTRKAAVTLGAVSVYAPVSLKEGLAFDRCTEVTPVFYDRNAASLRIVDDGAQRFLAGWVQPRMAAFFQLRRSEARSERLAVAEREDGTLEVVNGLGAAVERLILSDGRGRLYEEAGIAAGERRVCARVMAEADAARLKTEDEVRALYRVASVNPGWGIAGWVDGTEALPRPSGRGYAALLEGCPFLERPVQGRAVKETARSVVIGTY